MTDTRIQLQGPEDQGRLDKVLADHLQDLSRSKIQRFIKDGQVLVDGQKQKANYLLQGDEVLQVALRSDLDSESDLDLQGEAMPLEIVYEDDDLLVVNKPAGLVVHPAKGHATGTLVNGLIYYLKDQLSSGSQAYRPGIVHRIDKDTSGLLVVAKNDAAHQALSQQLQTRQLKRTYLALVNGSVQVDSGKIDMALKRDPKNRLRWQVDETGKEAITDFKVLQRWPVASLVEAQLQTGRTHQIRVHLEAIGHPLIGDPVYRRHLQNIPGPFTHLTSGQLLHAQQLSLVHPRTGEVLTFTCKMPATMQEVIDQLNG